MKIKIGKIIKDILGSKASISVILRTVTVNGKVIVSDVKGDELKIVIEGGVADIDAASVVVNGDVNGDIDASNVECKDVKGDIDASNVTCGKVVGNIDASCVISG